MVFIIFDCDEKLKTKIKQVANIEGKRGISSLLRQVAGDYCAKKLSDENEKQL